MQTPDLSPLIKGVIGIVRVAISIGQYPKLERWSKRQAIEAVRWKQGLPYFFAGQLVYRHLPLPVKTAILTGKKAGGVWQPMQRRSSHPKGR